MRHHIVADRCMALRSVLTKRVNKYTDLSFKRLPRTKLNDAMNVSLQTTLSTRYPYRTTVTNKREEHFSLCRPDSGYRKGERSRPYV